MYYTLLLLATALPAWCGLIPNQDFLFPEEGEIQSCTIKLPSSYQGIAQDNPTRQFTRSTLFFANQDAGGKDTFDTIVRFSGIPTGAFGCTLAFAINSTFPLRLTGNSQLNVYSLPKDSSETDTYETYFPNGGKGEPAGTSLFGTFTPSAGGGAVINSKACAPALSFLFEIASDTAAGSVRFFDAQSPPPNVGGFTLSYNC